jgi:N-acetylneuraminic acid mutarotase
VTSPVRKAATLSIAVLLLAACGAGAPTSSGGGETATSTRSRLPDETSSPGNAHTVLDDPERGWTRLPTPPEVRTSSAYAWTGEQLIVWGGYVYSGFSDEVAQADGFAFDGETRRWESIAASPLSARTAPAAAWTGAELLVWGGSTTPDLGGFVADGAAYDPANDTWRMLPPAPIDARAPLSVWTGRELIVWGTAVRVQERPRDGAAYDPETNRWRSIARAPIELTDATAAWTGREMVVFGAALHGGNKAETESAIAAAYDPVADVWRRLPDSGLSPQASTAAWSGHELIAWDYLTASAALDLQRGSWRRLPRVPLDDSECRPDSVSVSEYIVGDYCGSTVLFEHRDDRWHDITHPKLAWMGVTLVAADQVVLAMGRDVDTHEEAMMAYRP